MNTQDFKRKLTAILSADVKGYSRLMGQDEEATVKTLKQYRATISALVNEHRGRVVDSPCDNILAEFGSVVDAVKCAVKVQKTLKGKKSELPENRRMEFRIEAFSMPGRPERPGMRRVAQITGPCPVRGSG